MTRSTGMMMDGAVSENSIASSQVKTSAPASADDYSSTNIQVQGVDEPDFVKK